MKWIGVSEKTLWDWLQLLTALAIPVAIAIGTMWFSAQQNEASSRSNDRQHQTDLQIANDQQQETALQTYLDHMSDLLLNNKLHESHPGDEVRNVARARTLTVLPQLNGTRKGEFVQFLYEAGLIDQKNEIISLYSANLDDADLSSAHLNDADFSNAYLSGANFYYADLSGANFYYADLSGANFIGANLSGANLSISLPIGANLSYADLSGANLIGTQLTADQLKEVTSLKNTTMYDGSIHP